MDVGEWLSGIKKLDQMIEGKIAERERLIALATDISPRMPDGMPYSNTGTVSQKMQDAVIDLIMLEKEIEKLIAEYVNKKQTIVAVLEKLPVREYSVLHRYYIRNMTLEAIGEDMGYCARQVKRIKKRALAMLKDVLECHHVIVL